MIPLLQWAAQLVIDFDFLDIPFLKNEDDWQEWGSNLKLIEFFNDIPLTYHYNNVWEWAIDFYSFIVDTKTV